MHQYMSPTYNLARTVRGKFQSQAESKDHNLRILVAHANLYDNLLEVLEQEQQEPARKMEPVDPRVVHIENVSRERRSRSVKFAPTKAHPRTKADSSRRASQPVVKAPITTPASKGDQLRDGYSTVSVDEVELSDEDEDLSEDDDEAGLELGDSLPEIYNESDSETDSDSDDESFYDEFDDMDAYESKYSHYTHETVLEIARDLEASKSAC